MKIKKKNIFVHKCNYCNRELTLNGPDYDTYVITAEHKYFCIIQDPGKPAERDCLKNYLEEIKNKNELPIKKKLEEKDTKLEVVELENIDGHAMFIKFGKEPLMKAA